MLLTAAFANVENDTRLRVLVLCTGNSARSIMAEALLNTVGASLFRAFSAGSKPTGQVNPLALEQIDRLKLPADMEVRSKSWLEYAALSAPQLDLVLTVCGNAAAETCPTFQGMYQRVHWGFPDPAGSSGDVDQERQAFACCYREMKMRIEQLVREFPEHSSPAAVIDAMRGLA